MEETWSARASLPILQIWCGRLTACNVAFIEFGNSGGIGAYEVAGFTDALTDTEYLQIAQKYLNRGSDIGMFLNAKQDTGKKMWTWRQKMGWHFSVSARTQAMEHSPMTAIKDIKKRNMKAFYFAMKAYLLPPAQLAEEAKKLEAAGLDRIYHHGFRRHHAPRPGCRLYRSPG